MKQLPSLPRRDQFQSTDIRRLWVFVIEIDVSHHLLHFLVVSRGFFFDLGLDELQFLLVRGFETLWDQIFWNEF